MKSIASAPGKIILFGEHFVVHGTKAILAAIDKRVTVTTTFTENKTIKVNSELGTIEVPMTIKDGEPKMNEDKDENGNIIGVVVSQLNKLKVAKAIGSLPELVNFGIKASTVKQFLNSSGGLLEM